MDPRIIIPLLLLALIDLAAFTVTFLYENFLLSFISLSSFLMIIIFLLFNTARAINRERNQARSIIDSLSDGIIEHDQNYKVLMINPEFESLVKLAGREILGKKFPPEKNPPKNLSSLYKILFPENDPDSKINSGEKPARHEVRLSEDPFVVAEITIVPISETRSTTIRIIHDVTREHIIGRAKSEFISIAAHQLRTPL